MNKIMLMSLLFGFFGNQTLYGQSCSADAGSDLTICDGDGSSSNYIYLDGSASTVLEGDITFEWTVLTVVGDGNWKQTLVITNSESDEVDPRFKYPYELAEDTDFLVALKIVDDSLTCESFDTIQVTIQSNMCPRADAGNDLILSNGCNFTLFLDGSDSEDSQDESISFHWSSLDGYDSNFTSADSSVAEFTFPSTEEDKMFSFKLTVTDAIQSVTDTVKINYLDNDAPVADAGNDISTCENEFQLSASKSYDVNWNELSYTWTSLDGLNISDASTSRATITSPIDLTESTSYRIKLEVNDGYCSDFDTLIVMISANICPIAIAGETVRIPKFESETVILNAGNSFDPEGEEISYEWTTPTGEIVSDSILTVVDTDPNSLYSKYVYYLKVMDNENAISEDSVSVIFSEFSAPKSPTIYAVASHARVLVSWDASSEASYDSLTGYSDFEGYKLYRSIDGGNTWGGDDDKLYDFNGEFVGWKPYAQFDYNTDEDLDHCIYSHTNDCEPEDTRQISISGLDPLAPRFTLGTDTGIEYSFVDSNVVDGVEYSYTVTAYDIGLSSFSVAFTEVDSSGIYEADTLWPLINPGQFLGPDTLSYYNVAGNWIRDAVNPNRGFVSLESSRGDSGHHNFITVIPGYTALDISFPDASDIEALFTSDSNNIGTGDRTYFIVDRTKIVRDELKYEIQAKQSGTAVDGMACEDPYVYGYIVSDTLGTPVSTVTYYETDLNFFEKDSISGLPGTLYENESYIVPQYDIISPVDKWTDQFKGIRFKLKNKIPLNISAVPPVSIDTLLWSWVSPDSSAMDSLNTLFRQLSILPELSYTNVSSYNRRLNFDYKIEFFNEPIGDTIEITNTHGIGNMYFPFRVTNMWTGKKVILGCNDYGYFDASPVDYDNGASDFIWTRKEEVFFRKDSLKIAGEWIEAYNYNLDLELFIDNRTKSRKAFDDSKDYEKGDTIYYHQMLFVASIPPIVGTAPLSYQLDMNDDGERNNPWRMVYPWTGGEELLIKPHKLFVDGDNWYSNMAKLGEEVGISDTLCLDSIKVVPNPYKASSMFNETPNSRKIRFTHLPTKCQISIYTISGEMVTTFQHEEEFDGNAWWNLRTGNNQDGPEIAPGLYIYVIEFPEEKEYCIDTYDSNKKNRQGSGKNDYYADDNHDDKRLIEKTKFHIGKFAVIR